MTGRLSRFVLILVLVIRETMFIPVGLASSFAKASKDMSEAALQIEATQRLFEQSAHLPVAVVLNLTKTCCGRED